MTEGAERHTAAVARVRPAEASPFRGRRFTFVLAWAALGGAERQALRLAHDLRDRGAIVDVIPLTDRDGEARSRFVDAGIPWQPLPFEWPAHSRMAKAAALASFTWGLRSRSPDILMPYCARPNILCGLTWRLAGASLCIWHQQDVNPVTRFSPQVVRRAARATPVLVSNSRHGIDHLVEQAGVPRERVFYEPNRVEPALPEATRAEWRERLEVADDTFVATMVAHLRLGKDVTTLLHAWSDVRGVLAGRGRQALLVVGGGGPMLAEAKAEAFDLGLAGAVRFLGHVRDVAGLLGASDVGVLSSLREGCPTFALEAMAAGLPVAGTDIAGMREAVGPDGYGYLAPPLDPGALASVLIRIAEDPQGSQRLGERNVRRVEEEFAADRQTEVSLAVLEHALAEWKV